MLVVKVALAQLAALAASFGLQQWFRLAGDGQRLLRRLMSIIWADKQGGLASLSQFAIRSDESTGSVAMFAAVAFFGLECIQLPQQHCPLATLVV